MTSQMIDAISIPRENIFKGAARVVQRVFLGTVPAKLEDIMDPVTYVLASGFTDVGATSEDGVTITRTANLSDGIVVDQRRTAIDKGEPETWEMSAECTLMDTNVNNLQTALECGAITALGATAGRIAQHQMMIDAPGEFTERQFAFIQEDVKTAMVRAWWFRSVIPAVDGEMALKSTEATGVPLKLTINTEEDVDEGAGQFGIYFEED